MPDAVSCRGGKHRSLAGCRFSYVKRKKLTNYCWQYRQCPFDRLSHFQLYSHVLAGEHNRQRFEDKNICTALSITRAQNPESGVGRGPAAADDYRTASPAENNRTDCGRGILLAVGIVACEYRQQCWRSVLLQPGGALLGYCWAIMLCGMSDRGGMSARRLIVQFRKHFVVKYCRTGLSQPGFPLVGFPASLTPENHAGRRILACLMSTGHRKTVTLAS